MADNVNITAGTGTIIATEDVGGGVEVQRVKVITGALHTDGGDVTATNALPVTQASASLPAATTMQNAAVANGNGTSLPVAGYATAIISVVSSVAMSGGTTINFEASTDNTTWVPILAHQVGVSGSLVSTATADGDFRLNVAGYTSIRARISAYSAGTTTIKGYPTPLAGHPTTVTVAPHAVSGDVAGGSTDSGNPLKVGGLAKTANPTAVTDGQRVSALFDKVGKQIAVGAIRALKGVQQTTITSSTAETTIVTAIAAVFCDLYGLVITNTSATVCKVTIKDSTAGTTRFVFEIPATETRGISLPVDSAVPQATVNTAWTATCGTSVAGIEITALYVQNV